MSDSYLVMVDTNNVTNFIYASNKLTEIRGASTLLDRLNEEAMPEIIKKENGELLSSSGGEMRAVFTSDISAKNALKQVHKVYREKTGIVQLTGVIVKQNTGEEFGAWMRRAEIELRDAELFGKTRPTPIALSLPLFKKCTSCRNLPVRVDPNDKKQEDLCYSCQLKRQEDKELKQFIETRNNEDIGSIKEISGIRGLYKEIRDSVINFQFSADMDVLAGEGLKQDPMLAIVYCDGNGIGNLFRNILPNKFSTYAEFKDKFIEISKIIKTVNIEAVRCAYISVCKKHNLAIPIAFLMVGGDDLVVAMSAWWVFEFTTTYADIFSEKATNELNSKGYDIKITVAAGVAVAKPKFPVYSLFNMSYKLMESAKEKSYKIKESSIDYWITKENFVHDFSQLKKEWQEKDVDGINYLYQRPYSINEFKEIINGKHVLSQLFYHEAFPSSRVKFFYELLRLPRDISDFEWKFVISQLNKQNTTNKDKVKKLPVDKESLGAWFKTPWQEDPTDCNNRRTQVLDVLDLKPFIK